ncbi:apolipoprotein A-I [Rattus norvegicus]|nr:apolipoprotein A-I [Rattus norvegicus]
MQRHLKVVAEEFRDRMRVNADALRAKFGLYSDQMRENLAQRLTEIKNHPTLIEYHTKASDHLKTLGEKAKPALDDLGQGLMPVLEAWKAKIMSMIDEAKKKLNA